MTNHDELAAALEALRGEVRELVPVPGAAGLRARATHQLRVRRTATAALAAAAVVAIAIGGNTLLRPTAGPPAPPVDSPTPSPTPAVVAPSPRPSPLTPEPLDDPIVDVDWRTATITIPPKEGCPQGPVTFIAVSEIYSNAIGPAESYPQVAITGINAAYGDLTGDGRAEAVISTGCFADAESSADGKDVALGETQLLVVTRQPDGTLTGLAWVGPPGAEFQSWWLVGDRLLIDAGPGSGEDQFPPVPGLALAYQWTGDGFTGWDPAAEYPQAVPLDPEQTGAPVRLGPSVASGLGCPDVELRLTRSGDAWIGSESAAGTTYTIPARSPSAVLPSQQYLFDLDRSGDRLLVTSVGCTLVDGSTTSGLAVFQRAGDGWQGISILTKLGHEPDRWWMGAPGPADLLDGDEFTVEWLSSSGISGS